MVCAIVNLQCRYKSHRWFIGGMDTYVRHFGANKQHDDFYSDDTILEKFKNYTTTIVSRYVDSPAIFGWELANDPRFVVRMSCVDVPLNTGCHRCNSTLSSSSCSPQTVTKWLSTLAEHVASLDPNHIIGSGYVSLMVFGSHAHRSPYRAHGFFCAGCPKLFSKLSTALTKTIAGKEHAETHKRTRELKNRHSTLAEDRGRNRRMSDADHVRRQDSSLGSAYDGSYGVDTEDILGIPQIAFSTFQMFPDQFQYAPTDPSLSSYNNTIQMGIEWIEKQAQTAKRCASHNVSEI